MTFVIRAATPEDLPLYVRLLPELGTDDSPPDREHWARALAPNTLIAERDGVPVALCWWERHEQSGYVRQLVVAPEARRSGAGRALLAVVADELRASGRTRWELNVKPENVAAIRLYESLGFVRAYASVALRLEWAQVAELPAGPPVHARLVQRADDAALERLFSLPAGQLDGFREARRVLLTLVDEGGRLQAFAAFNPSYPGSFPFRMTQPTLARPLLEAMRPHALPGATLVGVVVEDDEPLASLLRAHGAEVRTHIEHFVGRL